MNITERAQEDFANGVAREAGLSALQSEGRWGLRIEQEYRSAYGRAVMDAAWKAR